MKVIKEFDVKGWKYNHKCKNCESELEVYVGDLTRKFGEIDFKDPGYEYFTASCAVCKESFKVSDSKIPKAVQAKIKTEHNYDYYDR